MIFKDRVDAGHALAEKLSSYKNKNAIVLAIPRGGVVIGYEVSKVLNIPLDVIVVRKVGAPFNPELAVGAVAEGNIRVLDESTLQSVGISHDGIEETTREEQGEVQRRVEIYRDDKPLPSLLGHTIILVDDGLATGATAQAAIKAVLALKPQHLVFAVPVCAADTAKTIQTQVDDFISLHCPAELNAISFHYQNFDQITDKEVIKLLRGDMDS